MPIISNSFSHSGTLGDVLTAMCLVKILGGGDFYLRLNNMDKMIQEKLGWPDAGVHSGRMTQKDFDMLEPLMKSQSFINSFQVWDGQTITHEFEEVCRHHRANGVWPRNFSNQYAAALKIDPQANFEALQQQPWLECKDPIRITGRPVVISRNEKYLDGAPVYNPIWREWIEYGLADRCVFVGHESEHAWFQELYKCEVDFYPTEDMLHLSRVLAGCELFIGNQSMPGTMASIALGKTSRIELRKNETQVNNEFFYPYRLNVSYF
jgi:hypothetical protein